MVKNIVLTKAITKTKLILPHFLINGNDQADYHVSKKVCCYKDCKHSCDTNLSRLGISVQRHGGSGVD